MHRYVLLLYALAGQIKSMNMCVHEEARVKLLLRHDIYRQTKQYNTIHDMMSNDKAGQCKIVLSSQHPAPGY